MPITAYMMFAIEKRSEVVAKHPQMKITDVSKELGKMWKDVSAQEKENYKAKAAHYVPKTVKAKRSKVAKADKPKRKPSTYMKFANAKRSNVVKANPGLKVTEVAKKLGEMWRGMSDEEKAKYA